MTDVSPFFDYARKRHLVYLLRSRGMGRPSAPDPIICKYKFTNVFRELDRTTIWFKDNVREPLRSSPDVLLATVLFRWFNRITTGEAIFSILPMANVSAWEALVENPNDSLRCGWLKETILEHCGDGPYVTGAYMIRSPTGLNKLDGILECVRLFMRKEYKCGQLAGALDARCHEDWSEDEAIGQKKLGEYMLRDFVGFHKTPFTLQATWEWLKKVDLLGDFMAYEIVTDLRHTDLLCNAPDIMTWANPGPGAMRGLNRIHGRDLGGRGNRDQFIKEMQELLKASRFKKYWLEDWQRWEMRDVEHTLCEFDKYERVRLGEGEPRGRYHYV